MDETDLPMLADKRIESNNFTELKLVLKNLNVRLSKNFRHTKLILGPISRCDSVQARDALNRTFFRVMPLFCGFCEKAQFQKPNKQNTFISFLLFLALNRSDIMMNFIDCFNCFKLKCIGSYAMISSSSQGSCVFSKFFNDVITNTVHSLVLFSSLWF